VQRHKPDTLALIFGLNALLAPVVWLAWHHNHRSLDFAPILIPLALIGSGLIGFWFSLRKPTKNPGSAASAVPRTGEESAKPDPDAIA
jgi:hypothetical protein